MYVRVSCFPLSYANGLKISFANCIYGLAHEVDPSIDAQKVSWLYVIVVNHADCLFLYW